MSTTTTLSGRKLRGEIRQTTKELFEKKAQLSKMREFHTGPVIMAPSPYRCETCGNISCLEHGLEGHDRQVVHACTASHGCLEWLP